MGNVCCARKSRTPFPKIRMIPIEPPPDNDRPNTKTEGCSGAVNPSIEAAELKEARRHAQLKAPHPLRSNPPQDFSCAHAIELHIAKESAPEQWTVDAHPVKLNDIEVAHAERRISSRGSAWVVAKRPEGRAPGDADWI